MQRRKPTPTEFDREALRRLMSDQAALADAKIHSIPLLGDRQPIRFILMKPKKGSICAITQEPIATSSLDGVPAYDPEHPERNAIHLPCQHDFTAVCLLLHWVTNENVRCPLCRAGPATPGLRDARLDVSCIPKRIYTPLMRHIPYRLVAVGADEFAARRFFEVTVGGMCLLPFTEIPEKDLMERLECSQKKVSGKGMVMLLSKAKSKEVYEKFVDWMKIDPELFRPRNNDWDLEEPCTFFLDLKSVAYMVDHIASLMHNMSFTRVCRKGEYYYAVDVAEEEDDDDIMQQFNVLRNAFYSKTGM